MNLDVNHFKNELSDYYYLKSKITKIEDMILELEVKRGVRAIRYDKEATQGSIDPLTAALNKLDDTERADYLEKELLKYQSKLEYITNFLRASELGDSIMRIHCTGQSTYEKESQVLYMGVRTLKRRVNSEILKYLMGKLNG